MTIHRFARSACWALIFSLMAFSASTIIWAATPWLGLFGLAVGFALAGIISMMEADHV